MSVGASFGGLGALADNDPNTTFWDGAWSGAKMGATTGTIGGIGAAAQYSATNNRDIFTGQKIQKHHSDPVFMGGEPKQKLTDLNTSTHQKLHKDMNEFLHNQQNEFGDHMRPQSNNNGLEIRNNFTRPQRIDALK